MKTDELIAEAKRIAEDDSPDGFFLELPYRNFIITGICTIDHEHGKGDCVYEKPKPRGGFEFL